MAKISLDLDFRVKDFTFSNESIVKEAYSFQADTWMKISFTHNINDLENELLNERERIFKFCFILEMKPNIGKVKFNGTCILESPDQLKISFLLLNVPDKIKNLLIPFILKNSYMNAEKIVKKEKLSFPPLEVVLKKFGIS
ncbi:MAG: hypothetical protein ACTSVK_00755 [Promethearchaeota archaeon]